MQKPKHLQIRRKTCDKPFDSEEIAGYDMDGTPITDEDLVQSVLTSSQAAKSGEVISHTEMKIMLGLHV